MGHRKISPGKKPRVRSSLMNIGLKVDYAVRALSYLAAQPPGRRVSRKEIQERQGVPAHYLAKIMKQLVTARIVTSHVGVHGGFFLAQSPERVNLKEVYECVEGPFVLIDCLENGERYCRYCAVCNQISVWRGAQVLLSNYLARMSIRDIADAMGLVERNAHQSPWSTEHQGGVI